MTRTIWTIARRELKTYFDHPTGYVLLVVFLAVNNFLFFRQTYLMGIASLRAMLDVLPWIMLFLVPAVTMRALAEDTRSGTIEVVLAQPVIELELLLGKYLGHVLFLWLALALTMPIPMGLSLGADLHAGVVVAQYVGSALLTAGFAGVGVWASSVTRNQITAFIVGVAVMFPLILVGLNPLVVGLPPVLANVAQSLGVLSHFGSITRGVIDLRDAVYFVTLAAVFLTFAYLALMQRKLSRGGAALRRLRLGTALLAATIVVVNLFGRHIAGRLDLTPNNTYTLSRATKHILRGLDDLVTIKLFVSRELPTQVALVKRDVDDLLGDFRGAGGDNVRVVTRDPSDDEDAAQEARQLGVPQVEFNVFGDGEFQIRRGYLGLAVQYADGTEIIPYIERSDDLEYRLVSFVRSLTRTEKPVVALFEGRDPADPGQRFQQLRSALEQNYEVRTLMVTDTLPGRIDVLVLAGSPGFIPDSLLPQYEAFFRRGGGALVMAGGNRRDQQGMMAAPQPVRWNRILQPFGVSVRSDIVYDLASNERVSVPTQFGRLLTSYPFWVRALSTRAVVLNRDLDAVLLPWPSSIDTSGAAAGTVTPVLVTSRAGGIETGNAFIAPQRNFATDSLAPRLLAVMVSPGPTGVGAAGASSADSSSATPQASPTPPLRGRVVVVGNHLFVADRFLESSAATQAFVLNAVDWLAQDDALIAIRAKDRTPPPLVFENATLRDVVKHANVIGVPALLIVVAFVWLWRRRERTKRVYGAVGAAPAAEAREVP